MDSTTVQHCKGDTGIGTRSQYLKICRPPHFEDTFFYEFRWLVHVSGEVAVIVEPKVTHIARILVL